VVAYLIYTLHQTIWISYTGNPSVFSHTQDQPPTIRVSEGYDAGRQVIRMGRFLLELRVGILPLSDQLQKFHFVHTVLQDD